MVRTVLVTGANRGLGLEFVRQFSAQGDRVIAACRRSSPELDALAVETVTLDVGDEASIEACLPQIERITDRLEVLVNNAGVPYAPTWEASENLGTLTLGGMTDIFRINAAGPMALTQACLLLLRNGEAPRLAFVSSRFSQIAERPDFFANNFGYSASKVSLNMFARTLSILLAKDGILTVSVDPGWARTDMGGPDAPLSAEESVRGMIGVIDGLEPAQSGTYICWSGESLAY